MKGFLVILLLVCALLAPALHAQAWSGILSPTYGAGACAPFGGSQSPCGVDWTQVGIPGVAVGALPSASYTSCTTGACATAISAGASATCAQVQSAINAACTAGNEYFLLANGAYNFTGSACTITVPGNNCALRGDGPNLTSLNEASSGVSNPYVVLGSNSEIGGTGATVTNVTGATAGATSITVSSATGFSAGKLFFISELNNASYVDISSDEGGACTFCTPVYNWPPIDSAVNPCTSPQTCGAQRTHSEIKHIDSVVGTTVTFDPPLTSDYGDALPTWTASHYYGYFAFIQGSGHIQVQTVNNSSTTPYHCLSGSGSPPSFSTSGGSVSDNGCAWQDLGAGTTSVAQALPFTPRASYVGVENLQIHDADGGAVADISTAATAYPWISGVEVNYTAGDWTWMGQVFRGVVQFSYFSNAYLHTSGTFDSTNGLYDASSGVLFLSNICERGHIGCYDVERGGAGSAAVFNYATGPFDGGNNWTIPSFEYHGAFPVFFLSEGNVWPSELADSVWGNAAYHTIFRDWLTGTNSICTPNGTPTARTTVACNLPGYPGQAGKNQWYSFQQGTGIRINYNSAYFNVVGSVLGSIPAQALVDTGNTSLTQDDIVLWHSGINIGYGSTWAGEWLGFANTNDTGSFAMNNTFPSTSSLFHGIYQNVDGSTTWQSPITHTLPASFFLSSKPSWWGSVPWPAVGPDVTGGTGPGGHTTLGASNPAQNCYINVMGGVDGGGGSPLTFNASTCYASTPSYTWTVTASHGTVTGTNCGSGSYSSGATIGACTATPSTGYSFSSWSGVSGSAGCSGSTNPCASFSITANSAATANFSANSYTLSTATTGSGSGTITGCAGSVTYGNAYSCTVTAGVGSILTAVSGCGGSGTTTYTGTMPASNCTVTATFSVPGPPTNVTGVLSPVF